MFKAQLIPVGIFELFVFRVDGTTDYSIQIVVPPEFQDNVESWIEAAACLTSYIGRHSDLGYEKALEIVTERAMSYRDNLPPRPPNHPVAPVVPDPKIPTDIPKLPNTPNTTIPPFSQINNPYF